VTPAAREGRSLATKVNGGFKKKSREKRFKVEPEGKKSKGPADAGSSYEIIARIGTPEGERKYNCARGGRGKTLPRRGRLGRGNSIEPNRAGCGRGTFGQKSPTRDQKTSGQRPREVRRSSASRRETGSRRGQNPHLCKAAKRTLPSVSPTTNQRPA